MSNSIRVDLEAAQVSLTQEIIDFVSSQKELWKCVPYYAVLANGVSGYSDNLSQAEHHKMYYIRSSEHQGCYRYAIDLEAGCLCWMGNRGRPVLSSVDHKNILSLDLKDLDANLLIEELKEMSIGSTYSNSRTDAERALIIKEANILIPPQLDASSLL